MRVNRRDEYDTKHKRQFFFLKNSAGIIPFIFSLFVCEIVLSQFPILMCNWFLKNNGTSLLSNG